MKTAHAFFASVGVPPFRGSVGLANAYLVQALETAGYRTRVHGPPAGSRVERLLPLHLAKARAELVAASPADLALYDDAGLSVCPPSRQWARRSAVFYHGLLWNPGSWLGNDAIDLHLCNSDYLARVLTSLLAFPDWERRRCLDPRAFGKVAAVPLALPCVEEPDGSDTPGAEIPLEVRALLDSGDVVGHALQPDKQDALATVSILFALNELAREAGGRPVRLLTTDYNLSREGNLSSSRLESMRRRFEPYGWTPEDFLVPVPALNQRALFQLMRQCAFGLSYNTFPEPFGFYVLESVHNGCPVFTNGCGNMRHLLPEGHGLEVFETAAMVEGDPDAYAAVAHRIHAALSDRAALRARCAKGRAYIDAHHNRGAMEAALGAALALPEAPPLDFESLQVEIGPLVRQHDRATGIVVSDLRSGVLTPGQARALAELPGRTCAELKTLDPDARSLFELGVLSLRAAGG
jgi:glycosyltransferase involved in cell wall biosynthesis